MAKTPKNDGKRWTGAALKLDRIPAAVQSQAARQGTSLKPTNQSPNKRNKKK